MADSHPFKGHDNPPSGAVLHYWLKEKPKDEVVLEVFDKDGKRVARITSKEPQPDRSPGDVGNYSDDKYKREPLPVEPGLHRLSWNLRHDGSKLVKDAVLDSGQPNEGPLVRPGAYVLKLTVDGKTMTRNLVLKPDPRLKLTPADYEKQEQFALKLRGDIESVVDVITRLRSVRRQIKSRDELLDEDATMKPLVEAGKELLKKLDALEEQLHNPKAKVAYDILAQRGGAKLYSQLSFLHDTVKDADGPIVQGIADVHAEQMTLWKKYEAEWKALVAGDLAKLNDRAKKLEVPIILAR